MTIYCPLSEALGINYNTSSEYDTVYDNIYEHIMCRIPGFPHDEISKKLISEKTKEYWSSYEGQKKKLRLIEWNRKTKSEVMKRTWKEKPESLYRGGRKKGSKDLEKRKESVRRKPRQIFADGVIYKNIHEASKGCNISVSGVKKRCQHNIYGWRYISGEDSSFNRHTCRCSE